MRRVLAWRYGEKGRSSVRLAVRVFVVVPVSTGFTRFPPRRAHPRSSCPQDWLSRWSTRTTAQPCFLTSLLTSLLTTLLTTGTPYMHTYYIRLPYCPGYTGRLRFDENYYSTKCAWAASLWAASYERWAPRRWWTAWRTLPLQCAGRAQLERCVVDFRGDGGSSRAL